MQIKPRPGFFVAAFIMLFLLSVSAVVISAFFLPYKVLYYIIVIFPIYIIAVGIYLYLYFKSIVYFIKPDIITICSGVIFKRTKYLYLSRKTAEIKIKAPLIGGITVISLVGRRVILLCELP